MRITFLSPEAALIGLGVALPLLALFRAEARVQAARRLLRLPPPMTRSSVYLVAICAFAALVAAGAAQPMLERYRTHPVRSDAAMYVALDTTKSMQATARPGAETRFDRARRLAKKMRAALSDVPTGVVSLTDQVLLHLFPTQSGESFQVVVDRALDIERPRSIDRNNRLGSSLEPLANVATGNFFQDSRKRRVLIVLTDAESQIFDTRRLQKIFDDSGITTILVRVGSARERVYVDGQVDPTYRAMDQAPALAALFAETVGGFAYSEHEVDEAIAAARTALGRGAHRGRTTEVDPTPLASYVLALSFLPLGFLLWRRNLQ